MKHHARHNDGSSPASFPLPGLAAIGRHRKDPTPKRWPSLWMLALIALGLALTIRAVEAICLNPKPSAPAPPPKPPTLNEAPAPAVQFHTPDGGRMRGLETIEI